MAPSSASSSPLKFTVRRREPELVRPARPTPREVKSLSDIDDQETFRFQLPLFSFYRYRPSMRGRDPAGVIREALAKALVFYYPFAGRLREGPGRKLAVDCTGEGLMFIEADADVALEQFGEPLQPPFPMFEELLYDVPGTAEIVGCPLLLVQVTRLRCGAFILAQRLNHAMSDASGLVQFWTAVAELAQGTTAPSVFPVWERHLLSARDPPRITLAHHEYDAIPNAPSVLPPLGDVVERSFFFGPDELVALRRILPPSLRASSSNFDVVVAAIWRCRTAALRLAPSEEVRVLCIVNARFRLDRLVPVGYYGNAFVLPAAVAKAGELCQNSLGYAVELVQNAKASVNEEYFRSVMDLLVLQGRPLITLPGSYPISDITRAGIHDVDFGWGPAKYASPIQSGLVGIYRMIGFLIPSKNHKGEDGILVPICLPSPVMEIFDRELNALLKSGLSLRSAI